MEEFNIENYKDYENVTIAKYVSAKANVEKMALESAKSGNIKGAWHYAKIYFELSKLLDKRVAFGSKHGYNSKGPSK